jgi:hypothetical protein
MAMKFDWRGAAVAATVRAAMSDTVVEVAEEVRDEAKVLVAVDTGRLDESIQVQQAEPFVASDGAISIEVGVDKDAAGQPIEYAAIQELGPDDANSENADAGRTYTYTPYMLPGLDAAKPKAVNRLKRNFAKRGKG